MPIFMNGNSDDFLLWIYNNIKYPPTAVNDSLSGRVIARFLIDTLGTVCNVEILRGVRWDLDQEVIRVIESSPKWIPARQGKKNIGVYYSVPIFFDINDQLFSERIKSLSSSNKTLHKRHNR